MPNDANGMVAAENRARLMHVDLQLIVNDWLNTHGNGEHSYTLPPHDKPLRQDALPDDARVLWAQLDQDDAVRHAALMRAIETLRTFRTDAAIPTTAALDGMRAVVRRDEPEPGMATVPMGVIDALLAAAAAALARADAAESLVAELDAAIATAPARHLIVGVESDTFAPVLRGEEPGMAFDHRTFFPPAESEG
jgi:hypothetical protein